jgi:hypothetical protein
MSQDYKKIGYKVIKGRNRVIYSKGDSKQYVKNKGRMMNVERYENKNITNKNQNGGIYGFRRMYNNENFSEKFLKKPLHINTKHDIKTQLISISNSIITYINNHIVKRKYIKIIRDSLQDYITNLNKSSSENYIQEYKNLLNDINNKIVQDTRREMHIFYFHYDSYKRDSNILNVLYKKYLAHYPEHLHEEINNIYNSSQQKLKNDLDIIKKTQEKRDKERTEAREKEEKLFQESYELFGIKGHKET